MSKKIVFCADGTWNDPTSCTNVYELFRMLIGDDDRQVERNAGIDSHLIRTNTDMVAYYVNGVGSRGTHDRILGGTMGAGLHARVLDGYLLISRDYEPGDTIYLFGFSRGAYTARSLAGFIATVGLMPRAQMQSDDSRTQANELWWRFKQGLQTLQPEAPDRNDPAPITLAGVWDTVGALGIPFFNGIQAFDWLEKKFFDFANKDLSKRVQNGRHALSIDESRADFQPTLRNAREGVEQRWFAGVHCDVGGGYRERGLSDIALRWMIEQASALGLKFNTDRIAALQPDIAQDRHDETQKPIWQLRPHGPRSIPTAADFHPSVTERFNRRDDYRPASLLKCPAYSRFFTGVQKKEKLIPPDSFGPTRSIAAGESVDVEAFAARWWNATGLAVSAGETYHITANGEWTDGRNRANADGYEKDSLDVFRWARRVREAPWFCLIASVSPDPTLETHDPSVWKATLNAFTGIDSETQLAKIGQDNKICIERDGYLYLFANDAAATYENNSGSIFVKISRV